MTTSEDVLVGRYRLLQQIGAGGMGVVWRAYDERLGRDVAVKRLLPGAVPDSPEAQVAAHRAMREARITARLHHPHAVPVFDVVEDRDGPCLVMQYFPSSSLAELVSGGRTLPVAQVARIGGEVASALAAAHDVGIVHRDVKPANVLVGPDGEAKISDFGISHALGDVSLTSSGLVTGTPAYLAPEVARGEKATAASDVFSLGSTLYTVLEGHAPFGTSENPMALLHRVASGEVEQPHRSGPLTALLTDMLAPRPEDRPAMTDVARRLGRAGEPTTTPAAAVPVVQDTQPAQPAPRDPTTPAPGVAAVPEPAGEDPLWAFRDQELGRAGPDDPVTGSARRRALFAVLVLAVVAAIGTGFALHNRGPTAAPQGSTGAAPSATPTAPPSSTASSSPRPSTSAPSSSTPPATPTPTTKASPPSAGTPTSSQLRTAVRDYYALLPADRDAGWERLTERYQRTTARNRDYYESFWGSVDRVSLADVSASTPGSVTATVTYHYDDGRVFVERTSYRLVREGGELKIDESSVLSSVQR
ncbi:MAG TPA: protein kinase [Ornithinibacter sp.]|nr:protein kinase [Ornithinibacter sp.]